MSDLLRRLGKLSPEQRSLLAARLARRQDAPANSRLVAFIVPRAGRSIDIESVRNILTERLPEYMVPSFILSLVALPLTPNGKVDRNTLERIKPVHPVSQTGLSEPVSETEKALTRIWSDVLALESVGIHDNFFEIGGDSILSIHIIARARQAGLEITPALLFKHPTISTLADYLDDQHQNILKDGRDKFEV